MYLPFKPVAALLLATSLSATAVTADDLAVSMPQNVSLTQAQIDNVVSVVSDASDRWIAAFNNGDAATAAAQYTHNAVMVVEPFGTYTGRSEIQEFWENIIESGFDDVEYILPEIEVISANSAIISSGWRMNNAFGLITKELWILDENGTALLAEDEFQILMSR